MRGGILQGAGQGSRKRWRGAGGGGWGRKEHSGGGGTDRAGQNQDMAQPPVLRCYWARCLLVETDGKPTGDWEEGSTEEELGVAAVGLSPTEPPSRAAS